MGTNGWERGARRIAELSDRGLDLVSFWEGCSEVLGGSVPHYLSPCWYTLDPHSLLITSHVQADVAELPADWLEQEYGDDDVNKLADVARSPVGVSTLHDATGGDPSRSARWHENMRYGGDQEMIAALRLRRGEVWGAVGLYREPGAPRFTADELGFVRQLSSDLARGARRALLFGRATAPDTDADPLTPGLVVVDRAGEPASMTPVTPRLLEQLPEGYPSGGRLPAAVRAVAAQARNQPPRAGDDAEDGTVIDVRGRDGRWLTLHGAVLPDADGDRAVVIIEPAHPARIASLLMDALGLTAREQEVTRLVLRGCPTTQVSRELGISAHTVQEHLKHIFDKTGVRTRRDLVASVFFGFYEPRLRDNERRTAEKRPVLGEPWSARPRGR